jgi:hypothetical protein
MDVSNETKDPLEAETTTPGVEEEDTPGNGDSSSSGGGAGGKKRSSGEASAPSPTTSTREKRARKSTTIQVYKPEDFSQVDHTPQFIAGKGTTLVDIPKVKETIENLKDNAEELFMAYRFLFSIRARVKPKEIKENLLKFNGYLPKLAQDADEAEIAKAEEAIEVRRIRTLLTLL